MYGGSTKGGSRLVFDVLGFARASNRIVCGHRLRCTPEDDETHMYDVDVVCVVTSNIL